MSLGSIGEGNVHAQHNSLTPNYTAASPSLQRIVVKHLIPRPVYPNEEIMDPTPEHVVVNEAVGKATMNAAVKGDKENRLRQRLNACRMGIMQLESLRTKHISLMQDMRKHMNLDGTPGISDYISQVEAETVIRSSSPAPSISISHRSSLSMDSGCLSMVSDPPSGCSQRKLSLVSSTDDTVDCHFDHSYPHEHKLLVCALDSAAPVESRSRRAHYSLPPRPKSAYNYPEENTVVVDDDGPHYSTPRIVRSESVHVNSVNYAAELTLAVSPPIPISPSLSMLRQKKTYCTGSLRGNPTVSKGLCRDSTVRASCILVDNGSPPTRRPLPPPPPPPPTRSPPSARPQSVAWMMCPEFYNASTRKQTTWEDVKRMLDPLFEVRKAKATSSPPIVHSPLKQRQSTSSSLAITPTPPRRAPSSDSNTNSFRSSHDDLSRSISDQSSDSNKSSAKSLKREKDWHESEKL